MTDFAMIDESTTGVPLDTPGVATFYVVPWTLETVNHSSGKTTLVACRYYDDQWNQIESGTPMQSGAAFFQLAQRATTQGGNEKPPAELDLTLVSAVAKTLNSACNLDNSFIAAGKPKATWLIIPVMPDTKRGVILVFRSPADGDKVDYLVATSDPEIKNGSN
ncbi:hypothetical protein [Roseateles noduli]|uniref:hypothetical protein n=1 Tax=Roseateles noduli TaxID=2052484 RepID=UPI003D64E7BE